MTLQNDNRSQREQISNCAQGQWRQKHPGSRYGKYPYYNLSTSKNVLYFCKEEVEPKNHPFAVKGGGGNLRTTKEVEVT